AVAPGLLAGELPLALPLDVPVVEDLVAEALPLEELRQGRVGDGVSFLRGVRAQLLRGRVARARLDGVRGREEQHARDEDGHRSATARLHVNWSLRLDVPVRVVPRRALARVIVRRTQPPFSSANPRIDATISSIGMSGSAWIRTRAGSTGSRPSPQRLRPVGPIQSPSPLAGRG